MNTAILVSAAGVATVGAGVVVTATAPTDWGGIAQALTALGVVIGAIGTIITGVMQMRQKKESEETKILVAETKKIMDETKVAVNGGMTKLLDAKAGEARAEGVLEAQDAAAARKGIEDAATLKERDRVAAVPAPAPLAPVTPVPVSIKEGPVAGTEAIRTKTDPMDLAEAAHAAAAVREEHN